LGVFVWNNREQVRAESPPSAKAETTECQIDQLVYKLYGGTEDEMKLIEKRAQKSRRRAD
jgi:hypothetical protein